VVSDTAAQPRTTVAPTTHVDPSDTRRSRGSAASGSLPLHHHQTRRTAVAIPVFSLAKTTVTLFFFFFSVPRERRHHHTRLHRVHVASCSCRHALPHVTSHLPLIGVNTTARVSTRPRDIRALFGPCPEPRVHACVADARTLRADPRRGIAPTAVARRRTCRARRRRATTRAIPGNTHALSLTLARVTAPRTSRATPRRGIAPTAVACSRARRADRCRVAGRGIKARRARGVRRRRPRPLCDNGQHSRAEPRARVRVAAARTHTSEFPARTHRAADPGARGTYPPSSISNRLCREIATRAGQPQLETALVV
jgi:hypothetical protein